LDLQDREVDTRQADSANLLGVERETPRKNHAGMDATIQNTQLFHAASCGAIEREGIVSEYQAALLPCINPSALKF
jgi:hypothetical protein